MKKLMLIGNLTADPELRNVQLQDGDADVCSFGIAVNNGKDADPDYYRITAWRGLATTCGQYLSKGKKVYIESDNFSPRLYTKNDGSAGVSFDVTAAKVEFLSPRTDDGQSSAAQTPRQSQPARQQQPARQSPQGRQQPAQNRRPQPTRQNDEYNYSDGGGYNSYDNDDFGDLPF